MATLTLNPKVYQEALTYAKAHNVSVEDWVTSLILRFIPPQQEGYKMKSMQELSPELLRYVGFAKPSHAEDDLNGDKAREESLTEKYDQL